MSLRRTVLVVSLLVLPFVFGAATAPAARGPAGPKAPTNLRITASSATSISLAWDAASSKSSSWWYCIQRDGLGCIRVDPPKTTFTFPNLWPGTTFNYSVVAIDANGNRSAPSNTVTYTTPPDTTPPSAPTLSVTGLWPTRVALAWTQSTDNVSQVFVTLLVDGSPRLLGCARLSLVHRPPARARDDAHVHDQRPRLLRQHRREQHRHGDDAWR